MNVEEFNLDIWVGYVTGNSTKLILEAFGRELNDSGVTRKQWIALYYIGKHEKIRQVHLAEMMKLKPSTITRLLDRLEKEELIVRNINLENKREVFVSLTEKGLKKRKEVYKFGQIFSDKLNNNISLEELEVFEKVLEKMVNNIMWIKSL